MRRASTRIKRRFGVPAGRGRDRIRRSSALLGLLGQLGGEAVAVRLVLGLQLLQGPEQLPSLARVMADALALLDQAKLTLLVPAAMPDGLLGLREQLLGG
jgi:hypothetical protein